VTCSVRCADTNSLTNTSREELIELIDDVCQNEAPNNMTDDLCKFAGKTFVDALPKLVKAIHDLGYNTSHEA
jgi:hypothetical protein